MKDKQALLTALASGIITVNFVKADSTLRTMKCTQDDSLMTDQTIDAQDRINLDADAEKGLVKAYDLDAQGWRSFKTDSVTAWAQA